MMTTSNDASLISASYYLVMRILRAEANTVEIPAEREVRAFAQAAIAFLATQSLTFCVMLDAYCWPQSATAGETIDLMVTSDRSSSSLEIVRVGAREQVVDSRQLDDLFEQPVPDDVGRNGCGWQATLQIEIDPTWTSGFYLARLSNNADTTGAFFVVKATEPGDALLVLSTSTYAAYNDWQAPSFYTGGHESSMKRPLPHGFLINEDPRRYRAASTVELPRDERRVHFSTHSVWSVAAGYANWEHLFVTWAEEQGLVLDYATSLDLATDPALLDPYKLYLSLGHDEYWTASMRDTVESWTNSGGAAVFLSGNTSFWQIRLEADNSRVIGYKFDFERDPVVGTDAERSVSTMWSDPLTGRPENEMTGVSFTRGGYANMASSPPGGGYTVHQPEHWAFAGLDLHEGDVVGSNPMVVGYECDGCEMTLVDGRPVPTGAGGTPESFEILGTAPAKLWETHELAPGLSGDYVGELNWVADRLGGADTKENRDFYEAGAAVMGTYERGDGWVFTTGCTDWAYGLVDPVVSQITRNVINRALDAT